MKKKTNGEEDIKPDLKHDTMEFSAATDGDDRLDTDDAYYEEEGIDADELAAGCGNDFFPTKVAVFWRAAADMHGFITKTHVLGVRICI